MLEDFRLKVFMAVAYSGSFTKAADILGVSQPAVSQNVAELEKTVGLRLFERLHGEVALTPQGHVFREHAARVISSYDTLSSAFSHVEPSEFKLAASGDIFEYAVSPAIADFLTIHPEVTMEMSSVDEADLRIFIVPASSDNEDMPLETVSRITISSSKGTSLMFDVIFQSSSAFASTDLCAVLKGYLKSTL